MKKVLLCLALSPSLVFAEVPNKFVAGNAAKAAEVNANFAHTEAKADANKAAIADNKTSAETNATSITSLTTATEANGTKIVTLVTGVAAAATQIALDDVSALVDTNTTSVEGLTTTVGTLATQAKLDEALAKITALEETPADSPLSKLEGGEISFDVDCTDDPAALLSTYQANLIYSNVNFNLTGQCYGDIADVRGADTGSIQIGGQTIGIRSKDQDNRATIIPNDETGSSFLYPGISGGLYLNDIDIQAGATENMVVLFSRNSHGSLINVNITGTVDNWTSVMVQEGGQVYIQDTNITGTNTGIFARNNGTVRFLGANTVDVVNFGVELFNSSTVNQQGDVSVTAGDHAIKLEGTSSWKTYNNLEASGDVYILSGSTLDVGDLNISVGGLAIEQSTVKVNNVANVSGDVRSDQSNISVSGQTNFPSVTRVNNGSSVQFNEPNMGTLEVNHSIANINANGLDYGQSFGYFIEWISVAASTLNNTGVDYTNLNVNQNSTASLFSAIGSDVTIQSSSTAHFSGSSDVTNKMWVNHSDILIDSAAISATEGISLDNSKAQVWGANINTNADMFSCHGMSVLEIEGWDRYDAANGTLDTTTNCSDASIWNSLLENHTNSLITPQ
jgi:hypothetical protein